MGVTSYLSWPCMGRSYCAQGLYQAQNLEGVSRSHSAASKQCTYEVEKLSRRSLQLRMHVSSERLCEKECSYNGIYIRAVVLLLFHGRRHRRLPCLSSHIPSMDHMSFCSQSHATVKHTLISSESKLQGTTNKARSITHGL